MAFEYISTLKDDQVLTDGMIDAINEQVIHWSDDRCCHWFFDFTCEDYWISAWTINNELTQCVVDIFPKA